MKTAEERLNEFIRDKLSEGICSREGAKEGCQECQEYYKILDEIKRQHAIDLARYIDKKWFTAPFLDEEYQKIYDEWIESKE